MEFLIMHYSASTILSRRVFNYAVLCFNHSLKKSF